MVEDDVAVAQMYKLKLELDGYLVVTAADGETGLSMAETFMPDLIVIDIALPRMDGMALLDAIRAKDRLDEIPILILTNHDDPETKKRSLELGARQFLSKSRTTPDALAGWVGRSSSPDPGYSQS